MSCVAWSSLPADLARPRHLRPAVLRRRPPPHPPGLHPLASFHLFPAAFRPWILASSAYSNGLAPTPMADLSLRLPRPGAPRMELGAPPAGLPYFCGASFGWLAMVDDERSPTRLVLWEPLSNAEFPLPCLSLLSRVFISGDPLTSSSWVAIATQLKGREGQTSLVWRPRDAAWTMMYEKGTYAIQAMTFHGGKAYYIDRVNNIIICDLDNTAATTQHLPPKCTRIHMVGYVANDLCRCDRFHPFLGVHLVACNGDLLLVVLRSPAPLGSGHPSWAEVYKPEWTSETLQRVVLRERVMDLGDYSLFLGTSGHTFALSAKEFPAIKRNCVYYADKLYYNSYNSYWLSVFSLESGVLEEIPYPKELKQGEARWTPYAWFCPTRAPVLKQQ